MSASTSGALKVKPVAPGLVMTMSDETPPAFVRRTALTTFRLVPSIVTSFPVSTSRLSLATLPPGTTSFTVNLPGTINFWSFPSELSYTSVIVNSVSASTSGALKVISVAFLLSIVTDSPLAWIALMIFRFVPAIVMISPGFTSPDKVVEVVGMTGAM